MMKFLISLAISFLALSYAELSLAWDFDIHNQKVTIIGNHSTSIGFVSLEEPINMNCPYGHIYFDTSSDEGKAYLSVLTAAKLSGANLRIAYNLPTTTSGTCTLKLAALWG